MDKKERIESDNTLKKVASGTSIVFIGLLIGMLFNFLFQVLIARNWTETEFGIFSISFSVLSIATVISTLGFQQGLTVNIAFRRGKKDYAKIRNFISSSIFIGLLVSIIVGVFVFFLSELIAVEIFRETALIRPLKIISIGIPFFSLFQILISIYRGFDQVKQIVLYKDIISNGFIFIFILSIVIFEKSFLYVYYGLVASFAITVIIVSYRSIKKLKSINFLKMNSVISPAAKELVFFSLPLLGTAMLNLLITWTDILMLGIIKTPAEAGLYKVAYLIAGFISFPLSALLTIHVPVFSGLFARKKFEEMKKNFLIITKWVCSFSLPLFIFIFLFPEDALRLLFGAEYAFASTALRILSFGYIFSCFVGPCGATIMSMGRPKFIMLTTFATAVTNIILNIILIPDYGFIGAAYASTISLVTMNIIKILKLYKISGIKPIGKNIIKPTLIFISITTILYYYFFKSLDFTFPIFVLLFFVFNFIYFVGFILTKSLEFEDLNLIKIFERKKGGFITKIRYFLSKFI